MVALSVVLTARLIGGRPRGGEAVVPEGAVMSGGKQAAAELEAQFPGWHVWPSSAGRWWATRTGTVLDRDDLGAGRVMTIDADDTETLRAQLARQSRLDQAARP